MSLSVDDYKCPTGLVGCGGCAAGIIGQTIVDLNPKDFLDFHLLSIDTDARTQRHNFTEKEKASLKRWEEAGALTVYTLGNSVTGKRGAGAKPHMGRAAAESEESKKVITEFLSKVDTVIIIGSAGGGTGAGVMPVVAKMAKEMGKVVMARVIMPGPLEGRTARATKAWKEIRSIVPTSKFDNGYLDEFLESYLDEKERKTIGRKPAWRLMDKHTIVPELLFFKEIIQSTGDVNLDTADLGTIMEDKTDFVSGFVEVEPSTKGLDVAPQEHVNKMLSLPFQDQSIIQRGQIAGFYTHGPWPVQVADSVVRLIRQRVLDGDESREFEIIHGSLDDTSDNRMWMGVIIAAGAKQPSAEAAQDALIDQAVEETLVRIRYTSNDMVQEPEVPASFANRFKSVRNNIRSTREDHLALYIEMEGMGLKRPDLPPKFREGDKRSGLWSLIFGGLSAFGFKRRMA